MFICSYIVFLSLFSFSFSPCLSLSSYLMCFSVSVFPSHTRTHSSPIWLQLHTPSLSALGPNHPSSTGWRGSFLCAFHLSSMKEKNYEFIIITDDHDYTSMLLPWIHCIFCLGVKGKAKLVGKSEKIQGGFYTLQFRQRKRGISIFPMKTEITGKSP